MKRFLPAAAFALCALLVIFSAPAMAAAQDALSLWWKAVLPTLFPFFVCATLMERTGALYSLARLFSPVSRRLSLDAYALPTLLLGCISGYPSGARLAGMLLEKNAISEAQAQRLGTVCNLCSPMFLMGALCHGMLGSAAVFGALCLGHYGSAFVVALTLRLARPLPPGALPAAAQRPQPEVRNALPAAIADGMAGLIRVGGSIVFFLVIAELLAQTGVLAALARPLHRLSDALHCAAPGLLCGLLEFTGGCHLLASADIPPRLCAALCAFLVSFGGLCVMVQAMAFLPFPRPLAYLGAKLAQGLLAGLLVWLAFPYLPGEAPAMAAPAVSPYAANALTGLSLLLASLLGVAVALLLAALGGLVRRR